MLAVWGASQKTVGSTSTTYRTPLLRSPITTPEPLPLLPLCPTAPYHAVSWYTPSMRTHNTPIARRSFNKNCKNIK